jgi:hypothetical protein
MFAKPRIVFIRRIIYASRLLTLSTCPQCGAFVAASSEHAKLMIAESAHICATAAQQQTHLPTHKSCVKLQV